MVRPRLTLERLDGDLIRDHVFLKNKSIAIDKVRELSILTGADVIFLTFSPSGIPSLILGEHSNFGEIVTRFSNVHHYDREKRRLDVLQTLKGNFEHRGYSIDLDSLYDNWKKQKLEDLHEELVFLKVHLSELNHRKSIWEDPKNIRSIEEAKQVQESLHRSIQGLRIRKDQLNYLQNWLNVSDQLPVGLMQQRFNPTIMPHYGQLPGAGGMPRQQGFDPAATMLYGQVPAAGGGAQHGFDPAASTMFYGNVGAYDGNESAMNSGGLGMNMMMGGEGFNEFPYNEAPNYNNVLGSYFTPADGQYQLQPNPAQFGHPHQGF